MRGIVYKTPDGRLNMAVVHQGEIISEDANDLALQFPLTPYQAEVCELVHAKAGVIHLKPLCKVDFAKDAQPVLAAEFIHKSKPETLVKLIEQEAI